MILYFKERFAKFNSGPLNFTKLTCQITDCNAAFFDVALLRTILISEIYPDLGFFLIFEIFPDL
jgi:hypothetical protein